WNSLHQFREKFATFFLVIFPVSILSMKPHQEPRFLLPITIPILIECSRSAKLSSKFFKTVWLSFNLVLVVLFGILHQGGVVPAISSLSSIAVKDTCIFAYKTYMPPRYLL